MLGFLDRYIFWLLTGCCAGLSYFFLSQTLFLESCICLGASTVCAISAIYYDHKRANAAFITECKQIAEEVYRPGRGHRSGLRIIDGGKKK